MLKKSTKGLAYYTLKEYILSMPRKIRQLLSDYQRAGFTLEKGGKGSHRKLSHPKLDKKATLSGKLGHDAKTYQERDLADFLKQLKEQE